MKATSAFNVVAGQVWAILPESLEQILSIALRENEDWQAVETRLGRPLDNTQTASVRGDTAIIPVSGPIFRYANIFSKISGATSIELLARDFHAAKSNDKVNHIILNIDSPGGMVSGVSEFAAMVKASSKPVTAYVGGQAASAAYWIASAADSIVINDTAMLGSIGVVTTVSTARDPNKIEIVSSRSPNKRPDVSTEDGRAVVQANIDALASVFIDTVATNRRVSAEKVVSDFGQGGMLVGAQVVDAGMADKLGSFEQILKVAPTTQATAASSHRSVTASAVAPPKPALTLEQKIENDWRSDPAIRQDFLSFEGYSAYARAVIYRDRE